MRLKRFLWLVESLTEKDFIYYSRRVLPGISYLPWGSRSMSLCLSVFIIRGFFMKGVVSKSAMVHLFATALTVFLYHPLD